MVRVLVNESESLECMIIKTQIHQCSPTWMQNQTFKNERAFRNNAFTKRFCWDTLLHVHEKSENKVEKGPCGFRPFDFYSKLKIENQNSQSRFLLFDSSRIDNHKFTTLIFNFCFYER